MKNGICSSGSHLKVNGVQGKNIDSNFNFKKSWKFVITIRMMEPLIGGTKCQIHEKRSK